MPIASLKDAKFRHHAQKSRASGFCYVADCILSILALRKTRLPPSPGTLPTITFKKPRIMYLDLDLHFSDAVSQAFHSTGTASVPQTLVRPCDHRFIYINLSLQQTFSIHYTSPGFFPIAPLSELSSTSHPNFDPFSLSLPLFQGASDQTFARIWPIVERTRDIFQPDYLVVQCGVDGLAGDPCATWNWSLGGCAEQVEGSMGWCIDRILNKWPGKKLLLGGGDFSTLPIHNTLIPIPLTVRRLQLSKCSSCMVILYVNCCELFNIFQILVKFIDGPGVGR